MNVTEDEFHEMEEPTPCEGCGDIFELEELLDRHGICKECAAEGDDK